MAEIFDMPTPKPGQYMVACRDDFDPRVSATPEGSPFVFPSRRAVYGLPSAARDYQAGCAPTREAFILRVMASAAEAEAFERIISAARIATAYHKAWKAGTLSAGDFGFSVERVQAEIDKLDAALEQTRGWDCAKCGKHQHRVTPVERGGKKYCPECAATLPKPRRSKKR